MSVNTTETSSLISRVEVYRHLVLREHDLLIERSNMFLVYHSILMAGFALGSSAHRIVGVLPIFGLVASLIWLHIGHRTLRGSNFLHDKLADLESALPEEDQIYSTFRAWRRQEDPPPFRVRVSGYFGLGFPVLWAVTWALALYLRK